MNELHQQQQLLCRWERNCVVVELHDGPICERLRLSIEDAERLADQLLDYHLNLHAVESGNEPIPEVLRIGQVTMTYDTANELMNRLGNLVYALQTMSENDRPQFAIPEPVSWNWKQEGF